MSWRTGRGLLRLLGRTFMLVALDKGGEVGSCPPQPHLSSHFGRPGLKSDGLLPFKTIVLSFKSRLAFYRVFFGSGSSSCGVRGKGQKERGSSSLRLFPTVFIISPVGTCFSSPRQHVYCDRWSWRFGWVGSVSFLSVSSSVL